MKTLKVILHATSLVQLEYECFVDAPDDSEPDDIIEAVNMALNGSEFEEVDGDWHSDDGEWHLADEIKDDDLPRWRFIPGNDDGTVVQVLQVGESK